MGSTYHGYASWAQSNAPLAAVSWAARLGILNVGGTWFAFMGYRWAPWVFTLLALAEIINDKLPQTPSRKTPIQFGTRIITGTFSGFIIGSPVGLGLAAALSAAIGAVVGTLAGAAARTRLAELIGGRDIPAALLEDCVAVGCAALLISAIR